MGRFRIGLWVLLFSFAAWPNAKPLGLSDKPISGLNLKDFQKPASQAKAWTSNPFVKKVDDFDVFDIKLFAIAFSETDRAALINAQIVRIGDYLGSLEIVDISRNHVVIRDEGGVFRLTFEGRTK